MIAVAQLEPNIILAEPESQIGKQLHQQNKENIIVNSKQYIEEVKEKVRAINPKIKILFSTGIYSGADVYNIISLGAKATGCTSGVIKAENPIEKLEEIIANARKAWDDKRSVILGRSVTIPLINGEMQLGEFGRIYFADFDQVRARERIVRISVIG